MNPQVRAGSCSGQSPKVGDSRDTRQTPLNHQEKNNKVFVSVEKTCPGEPYCITVVDDREKSVFTYTRIPRASRLDTSHF